MPLSLIDVDELLEHARDGERLACAEYLRVKWDATHTNYYGSAAWQEIPPFNNIGVEVEPRLLPQNNKDPFHSLELNPDLRAESVTVTFSDTDKDITQKFQTYSSGVECEFYLYYPVIDLTVSIWFGQLQAPAVYGWKTVKAVATNGFRSRELFLPGRNRRKECTASVFGGLLPDADAIRSALCPYDRGVGGSVGNLNPSTSQPYLDCPKERSHCIVRLGNNGRYFGGFVTTASAVNFPHHGHNYLVTTHGNESNLKEPVRVIFGSKYVRGNQLLLWRRQTPPGYEHGFVDSVFDISEGPISAIYNYRVNGSVIGWEHINIRLGTRGQNPTAYAPDVSNFSSTAHVFAVYGWVDSGTISGAGDLASECMVLGFAEVCVYTNPVTKTRIWTDDRVWCLLELYKNQKFGFGYAESKFTLADWITASTWGNTDVTHTVVFPDGEEREYTSRRTTFNAILEGRPAGEQIEDICKSGAISVPFQHDGEFTISTFRAATATELADARVFTDTGATRNICFDGIPNIELSQIPDNKVVNEVEVRFEEVGNNDTERPITVDDRNQKLKAGRQLGPDYLLSVPKKYTGFGINTFAEAVRLAYRFLKFGEFDEGGTDNNLRVRLAVPFEQALGVKRYEIIKVVSSLLDNFTIGYGALEEAAEYFRVLKLRKISGGRCEITAQAYNHTAYSAFEVEETPGGGGQYPQYCTVAAAGILAARGVYSYTGQVNGYPAYVNAQLCTIRSDGLLDYVLENPSTLDVLYSAPLADFPWNTVWQIETGIAPAPLVYEGIPPIGAGEELTISSVNYDKTAGLLAITI